MILATPHGNREVRANFGNADRIPLPSEAGGLWSSAGKIITADTAFGLPAVMAAIRLLAETVGSLPLIVYEGDGEEKVRRPDVPQWALLHDKPSPTQTPNELWSYAMASKEGWGGAFLLKGMAMLRGDRQVLSLDAMDPSLITPKVVKGELLFDVQRGTKTVTLSRADIIYIPSVLSSNPMIGVSPVSLHREAIGNALALEEFGGKFFARDATPGLVISASENNTKAQRDEAKEAWDAAHRGARMAHGTAVLPGGWTVQHIGVSPADAQFIEGQKWSVDQVARIFKIHPPFMIGGTDTNPRATPEQRNSDFLQFTLTSHLVRIEQRLHADDDLFPDKTLRPQFLADGLLRADMAARYAAYTQARQAGWLSINDIRRKEGEPPVEGGDVYQETPVGGAPNLQPQAGADDDTVEPAEPAA